MFIRVLGEPSTTREVSDHFTLEVPGARFTPAFKRGGWDGCIRLLKRGNLLYAGLLEELLSLARSRDWTVESQLESEARECDVAAHVASLGLPSTLEARDYQMAAIEHALTTRRALLLSPTASGKSLVIYAIARYHARTLVVVPTVNLVKQLSSDFADYGYDGVVTQIVGGVERATTTDVTVSTWQSLARVEDKVEFMNQFDCVIVDEAHRAKAKQLTTLMEAATRVESRYGLTGTLDGAATSEMTLEGLFGRPKRVVTSRELMDAGHISEARVKVLTLRHPERFRRASSGMSYQDEIAYLAESPLRSAFVANLACGLAGPVLVLYTRVETHGAVLFDMIRERTTRETRFVHGGVDADDREEVRHLISDAEDPIVVASFGVFSTGMNAPRLRHVIFASPYKSRVIVLQSIGRGLRLAESKTECDVYDIADDLSYGKWRNHTLRHAYERVRIYAAERFDYKTFDVDLVEPDSALADAINKEETDSH